MTKKLNILQGGEKQLLAKLIQIIEIAQKQVAINVNSGVVLMFWHVGSKVNQFVLKNKRAEYGKQIVVTLSRHLSWSLFLAIIPLKTQEMKQFYAIQSDCA
ncbi:MAG: hypothetical protein B6I20_04780 [Bacteroidetes bacterium 4572_117]|nr:MAG: hypothetical protein B6I20_04780 [Bacteroidetes bacterium 4572_117]